MTLCPSPTLQWEAHPDDDPLLRALRWKLPMDCCPDAPDDPDTNVVFLGMQAAAIDIMDRVTHRRFSGPCRYEVRPCIADCRGCMRSSCSCHWTKLNLQRMIARELRAIVQITVNCSVFDGVVPAEDWRIDNGRYLVPIRDGALWPWPPQDLNLNPGDDRTWWIEAVAGREPGQALLQATADLACQLWGICQGRACDVPTNAVSITRDGVTVALEAGMIRALPLAATIQDLYKARPRPQRIWANTDPPAAVRPMGGDGLSVQGYDEIVISDSEPPDTTVVWIDTGG